MLHSAGSSAIINIMNNMYKVLILDDDHTNVRIPAFKMRFSPYRSVRLYIARSADEAIAILEEHGLDFMLICLDHDLNEEANIGRKFGKGTGMEVAQWIADKIWDWDNEQYMLGKEGESPHVILHSTNSVGISNMYSLLTSAEVDVTIQPRLWLREVFEQTISVIEDEDK